MLRQRLDVALALALVLGAFAYLPLLTAPGLVNTRAGGDSPFLLVRLHQMTVALRDGVFPVRWMPDAAYGLGYPFFDFYAPLAYYLASGLYFLGFGFVGALKMTQVLGFLIASIAMYRLALELWNSRPAAMLASLAYTYAPFHLVNVYVRGDSLGEFWAFAFYPLVFLALRRLRTYPSLSGIAGLAFSFAGLVLSHNISALVFTPFTLLYAGMLAREQGSKGAEMRGCRSEANSSTPLPPCSPAPLHFLALAAVGLGLGLALSAWYWAPALHERTAVQIEQNLSGYFFYGEHFRSDNLIQRDWLFNYAISRRNTPFALGLVQAAGIGLGLLAVGVDWLRRRRIEPEIAAVIMILFGATVLITPLSRPVWDHVPLLAFAQFPWRVLSVVAFAGSLIIAALAAHDQLPNLKSQNWLLAISISTLLAASVLLPLRVDYLPVTDADVSPERFTLYELFTGNIGSTVRAEYLPRDVNPRPFTSPFLLPGGETPQPVVLDGQLANAERLERSAAAQRWRVNVTSLQARLAFPLYAFPGWGVRIDGRPAPGQPAAGLGYLSTTVPQGEHVVDLALGHTPIRLASEALGLAILLLLLAGLIWHGWPRSGIALIGTLAAVVFYVGTLNVSTLHVQRANVQRVTDLTMDFQAMPYLHPNPDGVRYGDGIRLLSYTLSGSQEPHPSGWATVTAGQSLTVTLTWEGPIPVGWNVELALTTPAFPLFNVPDVLARSAVPLASRTRHNLRVPAETTPGLYLLRLEVDDADRREVSAHTGRGSSLGTSYLAPVLITTPPDSEQMSTTPSTRSTPALARFERGFVLERAQFRQLSPESARVDLVWRTETHPAANYLTSIRLLDASGTSLVSSDQQPLYGFSPTSTWKPGTPVFDRRWLKLPKNLAAGNHYRVQIILYVPGTLQELGRAEIPNVRLNSP